MRIEALAARRSQIEKEIAEAEERIKTLRAELGEIDVAERVFARLSGQNVPVFTGVGVPIEQDRMTVRQMIRWALRDAQKRSLRGMLPKEMRDYIRRNYGVDVGQQINTTASRMWRELKEIEKDEEGYFSLPKGKPVDDVTLESPSTGSDSNPEHGGEARQGGGA